MKLRHWIGSLFSLFFLAVLASAGLAPISCGGGGGGGGCTVGTNVGCGSGQVCENVTDGSTACFQPVQLQGSVSDVTNGLPGTPISGALVVALDPNGQPISNVVKTGVDGSYTIEVSVTRNPDGSPAESIFLRADAQGFQTIPGGVRPALPIPTTGLTVVNNQFVINSALTKIGLVRLPAGACTGSITGTAQIPDDKTGVLVVSETTLSSSLCGFTPAGSPPGSEPRGFTAIADRDSGEYTIFNLPTGFSYTVKGYAKGVNYSSPTDTTPVAVNNATPVSVNLTISGQTSVALNGKVNIVNPNSNTANPATSIILVVRSTLIQNGIFVRGESPPGLRAPETGLPSITGAFQITGIPSGDYAILAAYENDHLVRDPDLSIAGTDILFQSFGGSVDLSNQPFKVTGSIDVNSPSGSDIPQPPDVVSATPTFSWVRDASAKDYQIKVFDQFGNNIWTARTGSGATTSIIYAGPALVSQQYYQFRVVSFDNFLNPDGSIPNGVSALSISEDLKGVFQVQ